MKIYRFIILAILIATTQVNAQDGSPSPYSFFGLGDLSFKGTTENIGMGGMTVYADSIHYNINTPAALSHLKFVNLNLGMANNFMNVKDQSDSQWFSSHNLTYFSLALPIGKKVGFGMGILPVSTSSYQIYEKTDLGTYTFSGEGGNSRVFLAGAYQILKNLSIGLEYQYYFGFLRHENYWIPSSTPTYTKENDNVSFSGQTLKFSSLFQKKFKKNYYLNIAANYRLGTDLSATNRNVTQIITPVFGGSDVTETLNSGDIEGKITFPSFFDISTGYGKTNKWYLGATYSQTSMSDFRNPFVDPAYLTYKNGSEIKLGGFFIPQYNSITNYLKRVTYRAGAYYRNTGMNLYGIDVNDFGITFGLGLPAVRGISNLNLGLELGQRGKVTDHLVQEKYINLHIGISLNDRWFIKRKIN
jgi:hypothetical protein